MEEAEKYQVFFEQVSQLNYLEWMKLSHVINRTFDTKISSVSNKVKVNTEDLKKWFEL